MINHRKKRVNKLLADLQFEITQGILDGELDERFTFEFIVPKSRTFEDCIVYCGFNMIPRHKSLFKDDLIKLVRT